MSEGSSYFQDAISAELLEVGRDIVGGVERVPNGVTAFDGHLLLETEVRSDPGYHPSIAHCHVVARIGRTTLSDPLDACVMGLDVDRQAGIAKAAQVWVQNVGSVLFSMLHARPVMGAAHFGPEESWGVAGCHGFAGPMFGYGLDESALQPLLDAPLFDYASALAPPGRVHLAKVVLQARDSGHWTRTLEVDGHAASYEESPWASTIAAPPTGIAARFALFHSGDQPDAVAARRRLDDAIRRYVSATSTNGPDVAAKMLVDGGVDADLVWRVGVFLPLAFFRVMFARLKLGLSPDYHRVGSDGRSVALQLMREPAYARGIALAPQLMASEHAEGVKRLAMGSSTFAALNSAFNAGSKPENLAFGAPVVAEATAARQDSPPAPSKPRWRFW